MVASIVKDGYPGHRITRPTAWTAPYVFACPHAGRTYPTAFVEGTRLSLLDLRRSEDAYVDLLMPEAETAGVPVLTADFPRAFVDVNRAPYEMDPLLFDGPISAERTRSNRVLAGFGVIPKLAAEGRAIYARKLPAQEGRARIKWCYEPYHAALRTLITECLTLFGIATVIDWHSMPSATAGRSLPDIVFGDRFGASCGAGVVAAWEKNFRDAGFGTGRNSPYAGGYVTSLYGRPTEGVHVLQVEVNRGLYLDEGRVARSEGFEPLRARLGEVARGLLEGSTTYSFAAE
ncbi:N-formylglutamate amidohydrolase [Parvularcula dongshanensis]|uniref:N-formylglutamate amidohydrolase n=1 Tax=Parvularcula dongshanensis TaxID=1173995 RepID=A0A840I485_9PROT|nr:N-formylglutamate amidohydrolase [Parvularcula dongshanensis]MBB4659679.1 N-formylglutamate amidohydrolase [Parvularcula dongshanensis]